MPWTAEEMKAKGASDGERAAAIANAVLRECRANGGPNCERLAIATALAKVNKHENIRK